MENTKLAIQDEVLPAISDDTLISLAEQAEKRIDAMKKIKNIALRLTNKHDWVDQNGKPYLQASGSEKIARMFGISWRMGEPLFEQEEGGHFNYTYKGEFSLAGASIEAIGTRSSKDGFFKKYAYPKGKERVELPPSEIDKGDVKKSAYTNLLGNGITRLLGIRNLTYDDLAEYAHIKEEEITRVAYKSGKTNGKAPTNQAGKGKPPAQGNGKTVKNPDEPMTEPQRKAIFALINKVPGLDEKGRFEKISEILGLEETLTTIKKLTIGQASTVIDALNKEAKSDS